MDLLKFKDWLSTRGYGYAIYALLLPDEQSGGENVTNAVAVNISENVGSKGTVTDFLVDLYIRSDHPDGAIHVGSMINKDLDMKTRVFIDDTQIILLKAITKVPLPVGIDDNKRHIFHVQFKMLVSPTDKINVSD